MPLEPRGASYYTSVVKASSEANAAIGGAVPRGGNVVPPRSAGAMASIVKNNIIAQIQFQIQDNMPGPPGPPGQAGPPGPTGPAGSGGGSGGSYTPIALDIWGGSPPASAEEAINRLAALLYTRTYAQGPLAPVPNDTQVFTINSETSSSDVFVVKYNTSGAPQWVRKIGGGNADGGAAVSSDSSGNVYVTGYCVLNPVTMFAADGTTSFASIGNAGSYDAFIAKYDTSGEPQWIRRIGGALEDRGTGISTDSSGNVYVTGYCGGVATVFAADGTTSFASIGNAGLNDAFLVKYNTSGAPQWVRRIGGTSNDQGMGVASDSSGNVYVTGYYSNLATVFAEDGTTTFATIALTGSSDAFVLKYDTSGTPQWIRKIAGSQSDQGYGISSDSSGNVYVTGLSQDAGLVFAADGISVAFIIPSTLAIHAFTIKYDTSGTPQWVRRIGGNQIQGNGISTDSSGNAYVTGTYTSVATVISGSDQTHLLVHSGDANITLAFVVKYNTDGTPQWSRKISGGACQGNGISTDSSGNIYATGNCSGTTTTVFLADGTTAFATVGNAGAADAFVVKYDTSGTPQWVRRIGGGGGDQGLSVASDSSGNVYVTGLSTGAAIMFAADGSSTFASIGTTGSSDVFVAKYDTSGAPQWVRRIAGTGNDQGNGISSDSSGNVYVTGYCAGTATVFLANGTTSFVALANTGGTDAFVVKYDTSGTPQWARRIAGTGSEQGNSISTDSSGNIYVTGSASVASVLLADGLTAFASLVNSGGSDAFVAKYDTSGTPEWVRRIAGTSTDQGNSVSTDSSGNVYVTGSSTTPTTVFLADGITSFAALPSTTTLDAFVAKYDSSGTPQWVRRIAGSGTDSGNGISTDSSGNAYVTGYCTGAATVFAADGTTTFATVALAGTSDAFVVKYDTSGTPQWVRRISGAGADQGKGSSTDSSGNVYIVGYCAGTTIAYNNEVATVFATLPSTGAADAFVVKYDTSGTPQWVRRIAGSGADGGNGISNDSSGNVYVAGSGAGAIVFTADGITPAISMAGGTGADAIVVKYDTSGTPQWARRIGGTGGDQGLGISADSSGNSYVTGFFTGRTLILGSGFT